VTITRNGAIDETRVEHFRCLVTESKGLHLSWPEVFNHHIGGFEQPTQNALTLLIFEIQRHAALVPIDAHKVSALAIDKWWAITSTFTTSAPMSASNIVQ
jgi:hypothetical protein